MQRFAFALFLFCLLSLVVASCHSHCHDNGDCVDNNCECYEGWTGSDCSVAFLPFEDGNVVSESLSGDWVFYYTDITDSPVWMNYTMEDGTFGDCDLYIRRESFPSRNHYDYKDSGWDSDSHVRINFPETGRWIAGVYNYLNCHYTLSLAIEEPNNCPNDCSGHGTCDIDNTCICTQLYYGADCSKAVITLGDGIMIDNSVDYWEWQFYYFDSTIEDGEADPATFQIIVNQTTEHADTDLYIKYGEIPTLWDYDYRNAAVIDNYAITIGNPVEGRYFIGIYGYTECDYSILLMEEDDVMPCDLSCSGHGYCSVGECHCQGPFEGEHCEYMTEDLTPGSQVSGFAADNNWNYYTATANSANNMVITVQQDFNVGGDCDLYIRADEEPDRFNYDYRNIGFDDDFSIVVQNPLSATWYIGVYGYRSCQYFLSESIESDACPDDCSGNGNCVSGRCDCDTGFAGQNCGSPLERIESGEVKEASVGQNQWVYYKYTAPDTHTSITVSLREESSQGSVDLYMLEGAPPELTGFEYSDTEISSYHSIYLLFDGTSDQDHDFYIGVYGNANIGFNAERNFQLFVYSPPI